MGNGIMFIGSFHLSHCSSQCETKGMRQCNDFESTTTQLPQILRAVGQDSFIGRMQQNKSPSGLCGINGYIG